MARINHASLRAQLHHCRAQFEAIKQHGEASADTLALINALFMLVDIVVAVFLERTTPKTSRNSGLPSSRDGTDDGQTHTEGKSGSRSRGPKARHARSDNLRTVTTTHTSAVTGCRQCGHDLTGTACTAHEQRVEIDIVFETVERQVTAEIKTCPRCHTRTKGSFPATMPGPVQYGPGIVAYVVHLLCAQMVSLKRTAAMIQAMTGRLLSEATLLGFVSRLHQALEPWEAAAIDKLLDMPVLHVDETSLRVDRKNYWIHVCAGGPITVKGLHRNRGCEAINTLGIIPRYGGLIVHDCWKAYLTYTQCKHQLCGAHTAQGTAGRNRQQRLPVGAQDAQAAAHRTQTGHPAPATAPLHAPLQAHRTMLQGDPRAGALGDAPNPAAKKGPARTARQVRRP